MTAFFKDRKIKSRKNNLRLFGIELEEYAKKLVKYNNKKTLRMKLLTF